MIIIVVLLWVKHGSVLFSRPNAMDEVAYQDEVVAVLKASVTKLDVNISYTNCEIAAIVI